MSGFEGFARGRRGFLAALGGLGMSGLTLSIHAAKKSETALDRFNTIENKLCISPSSISELRIDPAALPENLTFVGTRLMKLGFMDEIADLYMQRTGKRVSVIGGGCDDGLIASRLGKSHFGELCCPVPGSPAAGMRWLTIAEDIKVVLTPPENPVQNISLANLRKVMRGEIRNWRELGGTNHPIALIVHNHCPRYLEPVRTTLLDRGNDWPGHAMRSNTDSDHLRHLARFRTSLGVDSWVLAAPYVKRGQLKALSVDGVAPGVRSVAHDEYALSGPLNLIFALWMEELMRPFLDLIYSEAGQNIIAKNAVPVPCSDSVHLGYAPEYLQRANAAYL